MIIFVMFFALTERIEDLIANIGTPGFNSFYFIIKYFILNPILYSIIPLINFSIIYFVIPKDPTAKKVFIIGFFDILFCLIISCVSAVIIVCKNIKVWVIIEMCKPRQKNTSALNLFRIRKRIAYQ
jgi:hypothetical protein